MHVLQSLQLCPSGVYSNSFTILASVTTLQINIAVHISFHVGSIASKIEILTYLPLLTERAFCFNVNI